MGSLSHRCLPPTPSWAYTIGTWQYGVTEWEGKAHRAVTSQVRGHLDSSTAHAAPILLASKWNIAGDRVAEQKNGYGSAAPSPRWHCTAAYSSSYHYPVCVSLCLWQRERERVISCWCANGWPLYAFKNSPINWVSCATTTPTCFSDSRGTLQNSWFLNCARYLMMYCMPNLSITSPAGWSSQTSTGLMHEPSYRALFLSSVPSDPLPNALAKSQQTTKGKCQAQIVRTIFTKTENQGCSNQRPWRWKAIEVCYT
jgi:hypothetical protein